MNIKKNFKTYILPLAVVVFLTALWLSSGYLKQSSKMLAGIMAKNIPLKNNPVIRGGEIVASLECNVGDTLNIIPKNRDAAIKPEYFDIMCYSVHNPVKDFDGINKWNLDVELYELPLDDNTPTGFKLIKGGIYIDIDDGLNDGSEKNFYNENIKFGNNFKWDYYVEFDAYHKTGRLLSFFTGREYPVTISVSRKDNFIRLGLPVIEKIKMKMTKEYMGTHFAYISLYDVYNKDGFYKLSAAYIDCTPYTFDGQDNILPVGLKDDDKTKTQSLTDNDLDILTGISNSDGPSTFTSSITEKIQKGIDLLDEGKNEEAEKYFIEYKDNPVSLSYLALNTGAKAGKAKTLDEKIKLVDSAFVMFDTAMSTNPTDFDRFTVLMNEAALCSNTPDEIFHKADKALADFDSLLSMKLNNKDRSKIFIKKRNLLIKINRTRELKLLDHEITKFLKSM